MWDDCSRSHLLLLTVLARLIASWFIFVFINAALKLSPYSSSEIWSVGKVVLSFITATFGNLLILSLEKETGQWLGKREVALTKDHWFRHWLSWPLICLSSLHTYCILWFGSIVLGSILARPIEVLSLLLIPLLSCLIMIISLFLLLLTIKY